MLLAIHCLLKLLCQLLCLRVLLLQCMLHLRNVSTLHISLSSQRINSLLIDFIVLLAESGVMLLCLSFGTLVIFSAVLLHVIFLFLPFIMSFLHFLSEISDFLNQQYIFLHHVLVILSVNLIFFFQTLLQRVVGRLKILFLVCVLLFDVWIDFNILLRAIFNIRVEG